MVECQCGAHKFHRRGKLKITIETILNNLCNQHKYGYTYMSNTRKLLEALTEYNDKVIINVR